MVGDLQGPPTCGGAGHGVLLAGVLNKNGRKDVYEDSTAPVEQRLDDLIAQMNADEKTAQMATLYGYNRVLKDYLPTPAWQSALWKDGIGNIDEQLNGYPYHKKNVPGVAYLWPPAKHAWALNESQRFFIEDTRLGTCVLNGRTHFGRPLQ